MREMCYKLVEQLNISSDPLLEIALALEKAATADGACLSTIACPLAPLSWDMSSWQNRLLTASCWKLCRVLREAVTLPERGLLQRNRSPHLGHSTIHVHVHVCGGEVSRVGCSGASLPAYLTRQKKVLQTQRPFAKESSWGCSGRKWLAEGCSASVVLVRYMTALSATLSCRLLFSQVQHYTTANPGVEIDMIFACVQMYTGSMQRDFVPLANRGTDNVELAEQL